MLKIQEKTIVISLLLIICIVAPLFAQLEKIADGYQFIEGPVWKDNQILFSDIPANKIYKWNETDGKGTFRNASGNSNGLALDLDGNLLMAQHGKRRVSKLYADGREAILASHYDGKRLNSPNDIAVKSDGSIFFTDPPYGVSSSQEELGYYGIYRISPAGEVQLLDKSLYRPNGITFSVDEKLLYVTDSEARNIYVWDVVADTTIANKRLFAHLNPDGYADGLKVNSLNRLFVTGPIGVWVFEADGTVLDTIPVPGQTSNCNWGDADGKTLYITSGDALYRYRAEITGVESDKRTGAIEKSFRLYNNYPNPFNPTTTISYYIEKAGFVALKIYDVLGREIKTLVSGFQSAGDYTYRFKAENLAGGLYFYQLQVGNDFLQIRKMLLVR